MGRNNKDFSTEAMGNALGWVNTNSSKPNRARSNRATYVAGETKPYQQQFIPGRGHVRPTNLEEGAPGGTAGIVKRILPKNEDN